MSGFNQYEQPRESLIDSTVSGTPRGSEYLAPPLGPQPDRSLTSTPGDSSPFLSGPKENYSNESQDEFPTRPLYKRPWFWVAVAGGVAGGVAVVVLAVVLPVYFVVVKPNQNHSTSGNAASSSGSGDSGSSGHSGSSGNGNGSGKPQNAITTGGDGSTVTKEDGTTFTYKNPYGGYWVSNTANPFDNSARVNSWTPPLNESWTWGKDRIHGVNLGGLFVIEPFIVPSLYEQNVGAVDEWTLTQLLGDKAQQTIEDHYSTFITEEDIAQIAGAGLNWVRLPIPFWAIEKWNDVGVDGSGKTVSEPFLARTCWKYILRVLGWARKYGIRVNLDLHTVPGSQNAYNHSGKVGAINWMKGVMGLANAERSLDYIRIITEFISQPEWRDVIPMFGIINEPYIPDIGQDHVQSFYLHAYEMVRSITGVGAGDGPMISLHDGFAQLDSWAGFLSGSDRVNLDTHPYFAFNSNANREPLNTTADGDNTGGLGGKWPLQACNAWGANLNNSRKAFGVTVAGEFSNAINDCGLFVNGVAPDGTSNGANYGLDCGYWENWETWSDETKQGLMNFMLASMDALGDWFFWTWKIGNSTAANSVRAPLWSYQLGLQNGWMPADPRKASGKCESLGANLSPFDGTYESWMTGGSGAGTIAASTTQGLAWPPASFTDIPAASMASLPQYTATGTISTLPPPSFSPTATVRVGNGWFDGGDNTPAVTAIAGCTYPDAWDAADAQIPLSGCLPAKR